MRLKFIINGLLLIGLLILVATNAQGGTLKIATLSPDGSNWMDKMRAGADEVKARTDGRVILKFYPGGVMGDDEAVLRKIRIGQLHGGAVVIGSLARFYEDSQIYGLPLTFHSLDEIDYVRDKMDTIILEGLEKGGFVVFGIAEGGFAYLMSKAPVRTLGDLQRQKMWIPDNDTTSLTTVRSFDVSPIPLSIADVRAGLQTGMIDTVAISPVGAVALQWHTQINYVMDAPLSYISAVLAVDKKAFGRLIPEDRKVLKAVMSRVFADIGRMNRQDAQAAMAAMRKQGIRFIAPSAEEMRVWRVKAAGVADNLVQADKLSPDIVALLHRHLKDFRNGPGPQ